jgi:cardiolipin synthase
VTLGFVQVGPILAALLLIYVVAVAIALIADDRDPTTTLAWILILWILPVFGLILYFFAGRNWASWTAKSQGLRDYLAIRNPFMERIHAKYAGMAEALRGRTEGTFQGRVIDAIDKQNLTSPLPAVSVEVWADGESYFPELIADIAKAEKFVHASTSSGAGQLTGAICSA